MINKEILSEESKKYLESLIERCKEADVKIQEICKGNNPEGLSFVDLFRPYQDLYNFERFLDTEVIYGTLGNEDKY